MGDYQLKSSIPETGHDAFLSDAAPRPDVDFCRVSVTFEE
jgi:hypothetical protein